LLKKDIKVGMVGDSRIEERPMLDLILPLRTNHLVNFDFKKNQDSIPFEA